MVITKLGDIMKIFIFLLLFATTASSMNLENQLQTLLDNLQTLHNSLTKLVPSAPVADENFRLPALTEEQQAAGVKGNKFYSWQQLNFGYLHSDGHLLSEDFLKNFFFKTMFQYYTHEFLNYDPTYNYDQWKNKTLAGFRQADLEKFKAIARAFGMPEPHNREEIDQLFPFIESIEQTLEAFKKNNLLQKLAAAYQRQKVVVEKLNFLLKQALLPTVKDEAKIEKLTKLLYQRDRIATDLQAMIYHFMGEAFANYKMKLAQAQTDREKLTAGNALIFFEPSFKNKPYYKKLLQQLDYLMLPVHNIEGFKLPE